MSILTLFKFQVLALGASYLLHFVYCTNWAAWNWQVSKFMVWWTMLIVPILGVLASCTLGKCLELLPIGCFIANPGKIWPSRHFTSKKKILPWNFKLAMWIFTIFKSSFAQPISYEFSFGTSYFRIRSAEKINFMILTFRHNRFTQPPSDLLEWFEDYLDDEEVSCWNHGSVQLFQVTYWDGPGLRHRDNLKQRPNVWE